MTMMRETATTCDLLIGNDASNVGCILVVGAKKTKRKDDVAITYNGSECREGDN